MTIERLIVQASIFVNIWMKLLLQVLLVEDLLLWNVHFRIAEAYLIAAEAQWMISGDEGDSEALSYINEVRKRAGVNPLTSIDKNKLIHEYRVEFAFEGHRWWTLKRFMEAHKLWNGDPNSRTAQRHGLWPYKLLHQEIRMMENGSLLKKIWLS